LANNNIKCKCSKVSSYWVLKPRGGNAEDSPLDWSGAFGRKTGFLKCKRDETEFDVTLENARLWSSPV